MIGRYPMVPMVALDQMADLAVRRMEDLIGVMEKAADQIASGRPPEEIHVDEYQIYAARDEERRQHQLVCILSAEDYFDLLSSAASEMGTRLDDLVDFQVHLPEMEFEEGMVTGGFQAWKGVSVEARTTPMEELLDRIREILDARGLTMNCGAEGDIIFCMPIRKRD